MSEIPVLFTAQGCAHLRRRGTCRITDEECYLPTICPHYEFRDDYTVHDKNKMYSQNNDTNV